MTICGANPVSRTSAVGLVVAGRGGSRWRRVAAAVVAGLVLTGCQGTWSAMFPEQELKSRPTFEEASATYVGILEEMRAELTRQAPNLEWIEPTSTQIDESGCSRPFNGVSGATSGIFGSGDALGSVPEVRWAATREALDRIAAQRGFTVVTVLRDVPGDHMMSYKDLQGAEIWVGTAVNTVLELFGGCFLSTTTRNWSTPSPSPAGGGSPTPRR